MAEYMREWIPGIRKYASENYETGGWDYVIECYSDDDLLDIMEEENCTSQAEGIKAIGRQVGIMNDVRRGVEAEAF